MRKLIEYLKDLDDPRQGGVLQFHQDHLSLMQKAKGSENKHQVWEGGYLDHIQECFNIADAMYSALSRIRPLPFKLAECFIVLYFHDIEKIWKYSTGEVINKKHYYTATLPEVYGIVFSKAEENALRYIHGENEDYSKERVMNELAAFCHSVDTLSARMWHSK